MRKLTLLLILAFCLSGCGRDPTPTALPSPTAVPTPAPIIVDSLIDAVLLAGPGPDFEETAHVPEGAALNLLGSARGLNCWEWVLVNTADAEQGWIMPALLSVDIRTIDLPAAPTPTPLTAPPTACTDDLALVQINNRIGKRLDVYMAGAEPGFDLAIDDRVSEFFCLTPGMYCYDLTDGIAHERGSLFFPGGQCTCWHWGGPPPQAGSCPCSDDPVDYARP
jgi:hypothetical protein